MLRIELDSVRKYRNRAEYRPMNRASLGELSIEGDGPLIGRLCALKIEAGGDPQSLVEVYRDETLCFRAKPLSEWASGKALVGEQPLHLRRTASKTIGKRKDTPND